MNGVAFTKYQGLEARSGVNITFEYCNAPRKGVAVILLFCQEIIDAAHLEPHRDAEDSGPMPWIWFIRIAIAATCMHSKVDERPHNSTSASVERSRNEFEAVSH